MFQDPHMLGDRRPADIEAGGDVAGPHFAAAQKIDDLPACRIGDGGENAAGGFLCNHMVTLRLAGAEIKKILVHSFYAHIFSAHIVSTMV